MPVVGVEVYPAKTVQISLQVTNWNYNLILIIFQHSLLEEEKKEMFTFTCLIIDSPEVDMHLQSADNEGLKSHQRNDSYTSQHSRGSIGYNSLGHSRQSSVGSEKNPYATHTR